MDADIDSEIAPTVNGQQPKKSARGVGTTRPSQHVETCACPARVWKMQKPRYVKKLMTPRSHAETDTTIFVMRLSVQFEGRLSMEDEST